MAQRALSATEEKAVSSFVERVRHQLGASCRRAVLFGSRARGKGREESDIDILVLLDDVTIERKHAVWDIACDILLETEIDISPLVMSEKRFEGLREHERLIARNIDQEGIPL